MSISSRESGYNKTAEFHYVGDSRWELEDPFFKVVPGHTYNLAVEMPNRKTITAVTTAPYYTYLDVKGIHYQTGTTMPDPPFDDIFFNSTLNKDELTGPVWIFANKGSHASNESIENRYLNLVTDHPYADNFNINGQYCSDLIIDGGPINDDKHLRHTWPAFKNMRKTMPDLPLYERFIRISHIDDNPFHLLAGPLRYMESYGDHFDFYFVSEEYDRYLRSVYIKNHRLDYDYASIFSSENIYSNIEGGVGIFGCFVLTSTVFLTNL